MTGQALTERRWRNVRSSITGFTDPDHLQWDDRRLQDSRHRRFCKSARRSTEGPVKVVNANQTKKLHNNARTDVCAFPSAKP